MRRETGTVRGPAERRAAPAAARTPSLVVLVDGSASGVRGPATVHRIVADLRAAGAAATGVGLLAVGAAPSPLVLALPLALAAAGFGVLTALGFAVFALSIPAGEEGGYSALYVAVRALAVVALPVCGWTIAAAHTYRAAFLFGGAAAMLALVPLLVVARRERLARS